MRAGRSVIQPFAPHNRGKLAAIIVVFALSSALGVALPVRPTARAKNRASVVEVAARQRTLAERYVKEALLVRTGAQADPRLIGETLRRSEHALLDGGEAPALNGDDDDTQLAPAHGTVQRAQL